MQTPNRNYELLVNNLAMTTIRFLHNQDSLIDGLNALNWFVVADSVIPNYFHCLINFFKEILHLASYYDIYLVLINVSIIEHKVCSDVSAATKTYLNNILL